MAARKTSKPKNVIQEIDVWGNHVHCTAKQWTTHIIEPIDGHPEMTGREADVAKAIRDPDVIRLSTKTGKAFAFETVTTSETLRVIVYYDNPTLTTAGATHGTIATAYPDDPAYSSQVGKPIYTKNASKGKGAK